MQLIATYYSTKHSKLKEHWQRNAILQVEGIRGTKVPIGKDTDLGGLLLKMDWKEKRILDSKELYRPSGFDFNDGRIFVASIRDNEIIVLDDKLEIVGRITNSLFSDIHSLHLTRRGILVASTGLDLVLEVDFNGHTLWMWWATDHGYDKDQLGNRRSIDKGRDHKKMDYPTLLQTTHLNSALYTDATETSLFVSMFHQGMIIEIDKQKLVHRIILDHLRNPHSVYRLGGDSYLASDTNNGRILVFNRQGIIRQTTGDFNWIQDTIRTSRGTYIVADANNHRILEINENGVVIDHFEYSPELKIYQIKELK